MRGRKVDRDTIRVELTSPFPSASYFALIASCQAHQNDSISSTFSCLFYDLVDFSGRVWSTTQESDRSSILTVFDIIISLKNLAHFWYLNPPARLPVRQLAYAHTMLLRPYLRIIYKTTSSCLPMSWILFHLQFKYPGRNRLANKQSKILETSDSKTNTFPHFCSFRWDFDSSKGKPFKRVHKAGADRIALKRWYCSTWTTQAPAEEARNLLHCEPQDYAGESNKIPRHSSIIYVWGMRGFDSSFPQQIYF